MRGRVWLWSGARRGVHDAAQIVVGEGIRTVAVLFERGGVDGALGACAAGEVPVGVAVEGAVAVAGDDVPQLGVGGEPAGGQGLGLGVGFEADQGAEVVADGREWGPAPPPGGSA